MLVTKVCWEVTAMLIDSMVFLCLPDQWINKYLNRGQTTSSLHKWIIIHITATVSSSDLPIHFFFGNLMSLNYFDNCKAGKFMEAYLSWRVKFSCWYPQHKLCAGTNSKMHRFSTLGLQQFLCSKWCCLLYDMQSCTFAGSQDWVLLSRLCHQSLCRNASMRALCLCCTPCKCATETRLLNTKEKDIFVVDNPSIYWSNLYDDLTVFYKMSR